MKAAIVGTPGSGRKTLMAALSGDPSLIPAGRKSTVTIRVPDNRIDTLSGLFRPKKTTWATVEAVLDDSPMENLGKRLQAARGLDVIVLVAPAFGLGADGLEVAIQELERGIEEMILADQMVVEKRLEGFRKTGDKGIEAQILAHLQSTLEEGEFLSKLHLDELAEKLIVPYNFLTRKPLVAAINIDEEELDNPIWGDAETRIRQRGLEPVVLCARLEAEIADLAPEEQLEFLNAVGLSAPAAHRLVRGIYRLMDLISFFTVGEDEVRAWPVRAGSSAPVAAGKIHSDIRRGFIRAEVVAYEHFMECGSLAAARRNGRLRTEGKDYVVQDGDIINFLFNV
ncbi:MAG: redox-regulated ATPase YchF [Deltaproteobacteria bacterium]|nr:redox-regulated ATPase YchF [Deltaproteobacteria bacterium]